MRRSGLKSASWWRLKADYCRILHCESVQHCASERCCLADFWPSYLKYNSDGGRKKLFFAFSKIISLKVSYVCVEYSLFSRTCKSLFSYTKLKYADDRTCVFSLEFIARETMVDTKEFSGERKTVKEKSKTEGSKQTSQVVQTFF